MHFSLDIHSNNEHFFQINSDVFGEVEALISGENFSKASLVFENGIRDLDDSKPCCSGIAVLCQYLTILFAQKDFERLDAAFDAIDDSIVEKYPEIRLLLLRKWIMTDNAGRALDECSEYLNNSLVTEEFSQYLFVKGMAESYLGRIDEAIEDLEIASSLFKLFGMQKDFAISVNMLGTLGFRNADFPESLRWFKIALGMFQKLSFETKQSMVLNNQGIVQYKMGDLRQSEDTLKKSLKIGVEVDSKHRQLFPNIALGNVYRMLRDFTTAHECLRRAYTLAQELQYPREEALTLEFLGDVYLAEGQVDQAERFYSRAMAIGKAIAPKGDIVMEVYRRLGEVDLERQAFAKAKKNLARGLEMSRTQGDRFEEGAILRVLGNVELQMGNIAKAKPYHEESVAILADVGARYELSLSQLQLAECLLSEIEQGRPSLPVTVLLNQAWGHATRALDNLLKIDVPWLVEQTQTLIKRISRMKDDQEKAEGSTAGNRGALSAASFQPANVVVHKSRKIKDLLELCDLFAQTGEPTLLVGETGTGKELFARRLHEMSDRCHKPMISVNVTALPESMFDREFFGHVKGAFSSADSDGPGFAGLAHGGTLFLDEIGDLPLEIQPKLLRLLQDGTYQSLGDPKPRHADIRLVAATNADLLKKVHAGTFRSDLYYRLHVLELDIPPLRERSEDILLLVRHFLSMAAGHHVDLSDYFDRDSLDKLERYPWPGNVREVSMVARRAFYEMKAKGSVSIDLQHPSGALWPVGTRVSILTRQDETTDDLSSDAAERSRILMALEENGGSRIAAAKSLEMSRSSLYRRMVKLGLID